MITIRKILAYCWSGWAAIAVLLLVIAAWQLAAETYGELVLPLPLDSFRQLAAFLHDPNAWEALQITGFRVLLGYGLALICGSVLGALAGSFMLGRLLARPLLTLLLGIPPIAWLVLALIWFGSGHGTPVFTVFVSCFPVIFMGALQGMLMRDTGLDVMARSFRLGFWQRWLDVQLPQVIAYLFPAWITALGSAWKVVVMAELLASADGVGAELARAQTRLDTSLTLAWICTLLLILLVLEYGVLEPVKRKVEAWREPK